MGAYALITAVVGIVALAAKFMQLIGWLEGDHLQAIASLEPGAGAAICRAMQSLIPQQQMTLEVASTNTKAISLYEHMGLLKVEELSRWYRVK